MPEEIVKNIYRLEIPLPSNPLRAVNSYIIKGEGRSLIVDTGMRRKECAEAMAEGLQALGIDLRECDFFITHFHVDHFGLVSELFCEGSTVYLNGIEIDLFLTGSFSLTRINALLHGFPEHELQRAMDGHPGVRFGPRMNLPLTRTHHGQIIKAGDYTFECVETPGHSFGHTCLYEADRKILIAGDHILKGITPNIGAWADDWNPLDEYLESLTEVARLDVGIVLPGHRSIFQDMRERIGELREHHRERGEEVTRILKGGPRTAYEVASEMSWDIDYPSFDRFPLSQRWFATGEALAHLKHLESHGIVVRRKEEMQGRDSILWSL